MTNQKTSKGWEKRFIKQIRSFLYCWYATPLVKERDYQMVAEELYWKAIHEDLLSLLNKQAEEIGPKMPPDVSPSYDPKRHHSPSQTTKEINEP